MILYLLDDLKTGHNGSFSSAHFLAVATNLVGGGGADGGQVFLFLLHNTDRLGAGRRRFRVERRRASWA